MKLWKPHKNRRQLVFRRSKRYREKPYSVVLNKIYNNVTFTFVPLMSFLTQRLCNMLDSQALAFSVTFENLSFISLQQIFIEQTLLDARNTKTNIYLAFF